MLVIPAIDLRGGNAVTGSEKGLGTIFISDSPLDVAKRFEDNGAEMLNITDLDASAKKGSNLEAVKAIREGTRALLQVGGGIRTVEYALEVGEFSDKIFLGARVSADRLFINELRKTLGREKLTLFINIEEGRGVLKNGETFDPLGFVEQKCEYFSSVYFRDTQREFRMVGPDENFYRMVCKEINYIPILACGGVGSIDDLKRLQDTGVYGAVVGKALYTGRIRLPEAIESVR